LGAKHFASSPVIIPELSNASHVWCGACASYVLDAAGDLWVFGCNEDFELGMQLDGKVFTPTQHVFRPVEILPSNRYAFFVGEGGILYASGSNENGQLGLPISRRECFKLIPDFIYYGKKLVQVKSARK
jgi:alpha-tubulin suppressor-like RCC1 family protein